MQHTRPLGPRALHGDVEEACGPAVSGDAVGRLSIDPRLLVREVGAVAAEFARRVAELVDERIARVFCFQGQIESLAQILGEETKRVGTVQARRRVVVLEDALARGFQLVAEVLPGRPQRGIVGSIAKRHLIHQSG